MRQKILIVLCSIITLFGAFFIYQSRNTAPKEKNFAADRDQANYVTIKSAARKITLLPYEEDYIEYFDIGFKKWLVIFEGFKSSDVVSAEISRPFPMNKSEKNVFVPIQNYCKDFLLEAPEIKTRSGVVPEVVKENAIMVLSAKGYLPGERITIRIKRQETDGFDTISFCPRPIILKDRNGNELLSAELTSVVPTIYYLHFSFNPDNRLIITDSVHGEERYKEFVFQDQPMETEFYPETLSGNGGISQFQLTYQNGDFYELPFPWGAALIDYLYGSY